MNKQELIEKFEQFSGHGSRCYIERNEILNLVKQLDGPEPVKIPQFVADWISFVKTNGLKFKNTYGFYEEIAPSDDVYRVMYYIFKESIADKGIRKWVADNIDNFFLIQKQIDCDRVLNRSHLVSKVHGGYRVQ
ncbi:hypothetical protein [Streptococcus mitis]|uniref:hypothetical protein n=1 Tax=Streptococcus mitis TaxID=28037 RepID=UPI00188566F9|nr:hypothetical protein [Streptococcus mitis]